MQLNWTMVDIVAAAAPRPCKRLWQKQRTPPANARIPRIVIKPTFYHDTLHLTKVVVVHSSGTELSPGGNAEVVFRFAIR